jgi:hypothetical protein
MDAGTDLIGLTNPGRMRPSDFLWQRLYLRPLPHQQASFAAGSVVGAVTDMALRIEAIRSA